LCDLAFNVDDNNNNNNNMAMLHEELRVHRATTAAGMNTRDNWNGMIFDNKNSLKNKITLTLEHASSVVSVSSNKTVTRVPAGFLH